MQKNPDFIIVGAGAAGCVLARFLSDDLKTSVVLLEAGRDLNHDPNIKEPINLFNNFPNRSKYYWPGEQLPDPGINNQVTEWTTGRLFGGGSSVNYMLYNRGTKNVWKKWEAVGGADWSRDRILAIFKRLEKFNGDTENPKERGYNGLLDIRQAPDNPSQIAVDSAHAIATATGVPLVLDFNDPSAPTNVTLRWQYCQTPFPEVSRVSSATAFLGSDVLDQLSYQGTGERKLSIRFGATVINVLWEGNRAIGVKYLQDGILKKLYCKKKVIICAGIYSTAILQRAGIGPKDTLVQAGVNPSFINENVGRHLTSHDETMFVMMQCPLIEGTDLNDPSAFGLSLANLPNPLEPDSNYRKIHLNQLSLGPRLMTFVVWNNDQKSKGTIDIQSQDPLQNALVRGNLYSDPEDLAVYIAFFQKQMLPIAKALYKINSQYQLIAPTAEIIQDNLALENYIRSHTNIMHGLPPGVQQKPTPHHWMGHCRMGTSAENGVVDSRGNVFGVENLMVADASIAPYLWDGNTVAPALMIGFNIADMLLRNSLI